MISVDVTEGRALMAGSGRVWCIVLAAGSGARFGSWKQFVDAAGERLVDLAVERALSACDHVVLVLPPGKRWTGVPVDRIAEGGLDRASSVRSGLAAIPDAHGVVVVHQAANPLASRETIEGLISAVESGAPAVFPGLRPADLVREVDGEVAGAVIGRDGLVLVQTPAAFRIEVLREAHASGVDSVEDTALVSGIGYEVRIIRGDPRNIHVATQQDLELVAALLRTQPEYDQRSDLDRGRTGTTDQPGKRGDR